MRDYKEFSLWSKTSLWKHCNGILTMVFIWSLASHSMWFLLHAVLFLDICILFLCMLMLPFLHCKFVIGWTYSSHGFFLSFPTLFLYFLFGLLYEGSFSCSILDILLSFCLILDACCVVLFFLCILVSLLFCTAGLFQLLLIIH